MPLYPIIGSLLKIHDVWQTVSSLKLFISFQLLTFPGSKATTNFLDIYYSTPTSKYQHQYCPVCIKNYSKTWQFKTLNIKYLAQFLEIRTPGAVYLGGSSLGALVRFQSSFCWSCSHPDTSLGRRLHFQVTHIAVGRRSLWQGPLHMTSQTVVGDVSPEWIIWERESEQERRKLQWLFWSMVFRVRSGHFFISVVFHLACRRYLIYCWRQVSKVFSIWREDPWGPS